MNNEKVHKIFNLINSADVVVIDDSPLLQSWDNYPIIDDDAENEILYFNWTDGEYEYSETITQDDLNDAEIINANTIVIHKDTDDEIEISLYKLIPLTE